MCYPYRQIAEKLQQLEVWESDIRGTKERYMMSYFFYSSECSTVYCVCSLSDVIERKRILAEAQGRVLLARRRIELMKQAYENRKSLLQEGKVDFAGLISITSPVNCILLYSWRCWRELNLAVCPKVTVSKILADLYLAIQCTCEEIFLWILIWWLKGRPPNHQIFQLYV